MIAFSFLLLVLDNYPCRSLMNALFVKQGMDDVQVRGAATDIFSYLVEYNPSMVREFVMQESQQNDDVSIWKSNPAIKYNFFFRGGSKLKLFGLSGHSPDQFDHRAHDLWYRPRAWWSSATNGIVADSAGSRKHAGYCKCEFGYCFFIVQFYWRLLLNAACSVLCVQFEQ